MIRQSLCATILLLCVTTTSAQTVYVVSNTKDNGPLPNTIEPNSLRWALNEIVLKKPTAAIVRFNVAGTLVVAKAGLTVPPNTIPVTFDTGSSFPSNGRFVIDARSISVSQPVNGLFLSAPGSAIKVPLTVLLNKGDGVAIQADNVVISDLVVQGGDQAGLHALGTANKPVKGLQIDRLTVTGAGIGAHFDYCESAGIGSITTSRISVTSCTRSGILFIGGKNNKLPWFDASSNPIGVSVQGGQGLTLGSNSSTRSQILNAVTIGLQIIGNASTTTARFLDISSAGSDGIVVNGCDKTVVTDSVLDNNKNTGISVTGSATNTTIGPNVVCKNTGAGQGQGLALDKSGNTLLDRCAFGPANDIGIVVAPGAVGVTSTGCSANQNRIGVSVDGQGSVVLDTIEVRQCWFEAILLAGSPGSIVKNSTITDNWGNGLIVGKNGQGTPSNNTIVGPGNTIARNRIYGVFVKNSAACQVLGNKFDSNNASAINLEGAVQTVVRDNLVERSRAYGIAVFFNSNNCQIGPGNIIRDTIGVGIKLEISDGCLVDGNQILKSTAAGIGIVEAGTQNAGHTLRSNLIDGLLDRTTNPPKLSAAGISIRYAGTTANTAIVASTIVNNTRGVHVNTSSSTPIVNVDSSILRGNEVDDYDAKSALVAASYSFTENPKGVGSNSAADPKFANPATSDYSLLANSPALGFANPGLVAAQNITPSSRDAVGNDRMVNGKVDAGALERQYFRITPTTMPALGPNGYGNGGAKITFSADFPTSQQNHYYWFTLTLTPKPAAFLPYSGGLLPLIPDWFTFHPMVLAPPTASGMQGQIGSTGQVAGTVDFTGSVPPEVKGLVIWTVAVAVRPITTGTGWNVEFITGTRSLTVR